LFLAQVFLNTKLLLNVEEPHTCSQG